MNDLQQWATQLAQLGKELEPFVKGLVALVTVLGVGVAVVTYFRTQAWKRQEYLAAQFDQLRSNDLTRTAMMLLDYGRSYIEVPFVVDGLRDGERLTSPDGKTHYISIGSSKLIRALIPHGEPGVPPTEPIHDHIRLCMDEFLIKISNFDVMVRQRLASSGDVRRYVKYWMNVVAGKYAGTGSREDVFTALRWYIEKYNFHGVQSLAQRCGLSLTITDADKARLRQRFEGPVAGDARLGH